MRPILMLCVLTAFSSQSFARSNDWTSVEKLKPGTSLQVDLWKGPAVVGKLESVSGSAVRLKLWDGTPMEPIARGDVRRIVQLRRSHLRDPHKLLATGAVIGGIAGATSVAVLDRHDCQRCKGFRIVAGGAAGAMLGFVGAAVVGVGLGTADLIHHSKVIYLAERPPAKALPLTPRASESPH